MKELAHGDTPARPEWGVPAVYALGSVWHATRGGRGGYYEQKDTYKKTPG
jgi:hypothetical protein